ncbi:MAG: SusD/RagB family nutrient-binding outer membrane lipoprotein [Saprospiraceae bacterium]|nr:SusD/RagB family nutrient-binding outer membrane lipoprotein [Saprospiraceae bacterium]
MKKILQYSLVLFTFLFVISSCDEGFDELNENQVSPTAVNPTFLLNNAIITTTNDFNTLVYELGIVQQIISPNSGVLTGANYNQDNRNATQGVWQRHYRTVIRNTVDVIAQTKNEPTRSNLYNMARILKAYSLMVLTDSYGDIPYVDAGKGFTEQVLFPKYDAQQTIYPDIIKELTEATAALDAAKPIEVADVLYSGNIAQWKKFGNSLLLRAGMRLSKVDAAQAQQIVQRAFQGGVIDANADNAVVRHDANYTNPVSGTLNSTEANNFYLTAPFVTHLKSTNDPRLASIAVRYVGAKSGPEQTAAKASTDPAVQIGMPLGYDNSGIPAVAASLGLASFYDFSQLDRTRMGKLAAHFFIVTAAQSQLLLAEAAQRGWITGNAGDFYTKGIRLHMEQLAAYGSNVAVPTASIDSYIAANPYTADKGLEQINTQYWIAAFLNGPEAFANFRRSGFPTLTPNPFPGKDISGPFIRRLTYPNSEISVNSANVQEAISRMGGDKLDTRVWWDK